MILDLFALLVLGVLVAVAIWLVVLLGPLPGKIARRRGHPQADAIYVLGWIGIVTLGLAWPVALVWAYTKPRDGADLEARVEALEDQARRAESSQAGGAP